MRPHVVLNAAISIDGKISTAARDYFSFGGEEDAELMDELRAEADAVMIGAATLRAEDPLLAVTSEERIRRRINSGRPAQPHAIVVSRSLDFPIAGSRFFTGVEQERYVCTCEDAPPERIAAIGNHAHVLFLPVDDGDSLDLKGLRTLRDVGVERLLLEGGGTLNFAMLAAGLIDEIHVTICPIAIGGIGAPTLFDGAGFDRANVRGLRLESVKQGLNQRLFLHYRT